LKKKLVEALYPGLEIQVISSPRAWGMNFFKFLPLICLILAVVIFEIQRFLAGLL
jgi:hypothetical protein